MIKLIALAASLTLLAIYAEGKAHAATGRTDNCQVSTVGWSFDPQQTPGANGQRDKIFYIICQGGLVHIASQTGSNGTTTPPATVCPLYDVDTIKLWESQAVAAKLAGKAVTIYFNTKVCAGVSAKNNITGIDF